MYIDRLAGRLVLACLLPITTAAGEVWFQRIGVGYNGSWSSALGVSNDGLVVVGKGNGFFGDPISGQAMRWTRHEGLEGLRDLDYRPPYWSEALGASGDGAVIVGYATSKRGFEAFRWTRQEGMFGLGDFGNQYVSSTAYGVSADGRVIVGTARAENYGPDLAFRWTQEGGLEKLEWKPRYGGEARAVTGDGSVIVGRTSTDAHPLGEAFRWEGGVMTPLGVLDGHTQSMAYDVSDDGRVVVGESRGARPEAFRWTAEEGLIPLEGAPTKGAQALAVSADGSVIVGVSWLEGWPYGEAFIWDAEHGIRPLKQVLKEEYGLDIGGLELFRATGISGDGKTIVGDLFSYDQEGWVVHIPEPHALLGLLPGLGWLSRRRRSCGTAS